MVVAWKDDPWDLEGDASPIVLDLSNGRVSKVLKGNFLARRMEMHESVYAYMEVLREAWTEVLAEV